MLSHIGSHLVAEPEYLSECMHSLFDFKLRPIIGNHLLPCSLLFGDADSTAFLAVHINIAKTSYQSFSISFIAGDVVDDAMRPRISLDCDQTAHSEWLFTSAFIDRAPTDFNGALICLDPYLSLPFVTIEYNDEIAV